MPHARSSSPAKQLQPNRSDLTKPLPVQAAPNQGYGEAAQQKVAQRAIPMGPPPIQGPPPAAPAPGTALPGAGPSSPQLPLAIPGAAGPLSRPTERPNEPVTHGLPMGPGGGPETLDGIGGAARDGAIEQGTLSHLLTGLAARPDATSAIKDLAARAQNGAL